MADSNSGAPAATVRRTPLYDTHAELGARFVPFAGWDMPVRYGSILDEARAVRSGAGLFDVSHMGRLEVDGADAAGGDIKGASGSENGIHWTPGAPFGMVLRICRLAFSLAVRADAARGMGEETGTRNESPRPQPALQRRAGRGRLSLLIPLSSLLTHGLMPVTPPSITSSVAVTKADSSDAR